MELKRIWYRKREDGTLADFTFSESDADNRNLEHWTDVGVVFMPDGNAYLKEDSENA